MGVVQLGFGSLQLCAMTSLRISERWTGLTVDGKYPLLTWLGGSAWCGVFLTELRNGMSRKAAIKLMPADSADVESREEAWAGAKDLKHPHLLQVMGWGRCRFDGADVAYVVTEYAPEVLAEILPERALTADEARGVLEPLLGALAYLHGERMVHGHVKPANLMANGDELKLTADHLLRIGASNGELVAGEYGAPELASGEVTPAADVWSLGVTLVEMLTQKRPVLSANGEPVLAGNISDPFDRIARACLRRNPADRCSLEEIQAWLRSKEPVAVPVAAMADDPPEPVSTESIRSAAAAAVARRAEPFGGAVPNANTDGRSQGSRMWIRAVALIALVTVMAVAWYFLRPHPDGSSLASRNPALTVPQENSPANTETSPAANPPRPSAALPGAAAGGDATGTMHARVLERFPPKVLPSALATIHGEVRVDVRVTVGSDGRVIDAGFADHGPSRYFADAAMKAAREWRFRPARVNGRPQKSVWLLKFGFTRGGSNMAATETKR